jgi:hypothetical protein
MIKMHDHAAAPHPQKSARRSALDAAIILVLVIAAVSSWIPRTRGPIDLRWDAAVYYILGTSIARHHTYTLLNEPGDITATIFPPLLPAVIAAHQWILGTSDPVVVGSWLRVTFCILLAMYFVLAYLLLRSRLTVELAVVGIIVCTLQWFPNWLSDRVYSDLPFAVAATAFFLISRRTSRSAAAGSGACAVAAYLLRSAGVALLVAWVAECAMARDWKRAARRLILAIIPVMGWQGYVFAVEHGATYQQLRYPYQRADYNIYNVSYARLASLRNHVKPELGAATVSERVSRFVRNAALLPVGMAGAVSASRPSWEILMERIKTTPGIRRVIPWRTIPISLWILAGLIGVGLAKQIADGEATISVALAVYAATVCVLPPSYMYELPRYMAVLAPALVLALIQGVGVVRARVSDRLAAVGFGLLFSLVIGVQVAMLSDLYRRDMEEIEYSDWSGHRVRYRLFTYGSDFRGLDIGLDWLNQHGERDAIVASSVPHWVYLRTGLRAVMPPMERGKDRIRELLDAVPVRYVVVESAGSFTGDYVAPVLRDLPQEWRRVIYDPETHFEMYARQGTSRFLK